MAVMQPPPVNCRFSTFGFKYKECFVIRKTLLKRNLDVQQNQFIYISHFLSSVCVFKARFRLN